MCSKNAWTRITLVTVLPEFLKIRSEKASSIISTIAQKDTTGKHTQMLVNIALDRDVPIAVRVSTVDAMLQHNVRLSDEQMQAGLAVESHVNNAFVGKWMQLYCGQVDDCMAALWAMFHATENLTRRRGIADAIVSRMGSVPEKFEAMHDPNLASSATMALSQSSVGTFKRYKNDIPLESLERALQSDQVEVRRVAERALFQMYDRDQHEALIRPYLRGYLANSSKPNDQVIALRIIADLHETSVMDEVQRIHDETQELIEYMDSFDDPYDYYPDHQFHKKYPRPYNVNRQAKTTLKQLQQPGAGETESE